MVKRYIDADALVTVCLYDNEHEEEYTERMSIGKCLDLLTEEGCPNTADRPQGEWHFDEKGYFFCSECKKYPHNQYATTDFCPNCGARMRGDKDD